MYQVGSKLAIFLEICAWSAILVILIFTIPVQLILYQLKSLNELKKSKICNWQYFANEGLG